MLIERFVGVFLRTAERAIAERRDAHGHAPRPPRAYLRRMLTALRALTTPCP